MNIGSKESAIRLAIGFAFIILTGLIFTPSSLGLIILFWAISLYLLVTGLFLTCPVYKLFGINKKN